MIMAMRDIKRPSPENNPTTTNCPPSDFCDEAAAETGIDAVTRAAFGMTGSPIHKAIRNSHSLGSLSCCGKGSTHLHGIGKFARRLREPTNRIDATSIE